MQIKKVAFLGGAAWKPENQVYKDAFLTAKLLAQGGYEIVNGGGPGVMKASTLGAHEGGGKVLAITYHPNKPKRHYEGVDLTNDFDEEVITLDYFDRTKVMLQNSDVHVVFNGSLGTISEFGMTWISSWIHDPDYKPIVLFGDFWHGFVEFVHKNMELTQQEDNLLKICTTPQEVLDYIKSLN
ncbi:MAG TPA: LOG family protein [Candidatus Saccharimonadales bacterium]|nr:LOG family protein [Candidatus Saccharimonadales bacterium]